MGRMILTHVRGGTPITTATLWSLLIPSILLKRSPLRNPLLSSTGHPSLHRPNAQESSLERISPSNQMARCAALPITPSMQKLEEERAMGPCVSSMRHDCPIVVRVHCGTSVSCMENSPKGHAG